MLSAVTFRTRSAGALAFAPLLLEMRLLEPQLLFAIANGGRFVELLILDDRFFFGDQLAQLRVGFANRRRRKRRLQTHARAGLVDQVDRFVGKEAVGDVAVAEPCGRRQGFVGNLHLVVRFVPVAQAFEDLDRLFDGRLADHDRLEAPLERRVFLDMLAELVERRRADALQLAARKRRLDDVAGVDRAFGGARADQRVQLVDEEDDLAGGAADLVHDALHALFELAAVLRAGDQPGQIERDDAPVAQRLGNVALDDALRQAFGDRRFADAGLADERRIVLGAPRENLNDALDLVVASDDGIELVVARELREVASVRVERRSLALTFWSRLAGLRHPAAMSSARGLWRDRRQGW